MQKHQSFAGFAEITPTAPITVEAHGNRAKCLQRLIRLELPVPKTLALPFDAVHRIASGHPPECKAMMANFRAHPLVSVRPSSEDPDWGGPRSILNVGMNAETHRRLLKSHGAAAANTLYIRFIEAYAVHVARLDPDTLHADESTHHALEAMLAAYEAETDEPFPQDPAEQLTEVLRSMARVWEGTTARLLRQAKGAPAYAGLGLVVQEMVLGIGNGKSESGSGVIQFVSSETGQPRITGRYLVAKSGPRGVVR